MVDPLLADILENTKDGEWGQSSPSADTEPMLVVRGTDFADVRIGRLSSLPLRHIPQHIADRKALRPGDVLIETAGGTKDQPTGRTALLKDRIFSKAQYRITCASFSRFLRVNRSKILPDYLYWYLQNLYLSGEMYPYHVQHTGVARFQYTQFATSTRIRCYPMPTQKTISGLLNSLDDKIDLNHQMNETLEAMARAIFKDWFVDFGPTRAKSEGRPPYLSPDLWALFPNSLEPSDLGMIPKAWRSLRVRELTSNIQYGLTQSAAVQNIGPQFLRITDIQGGRVDWSKVPFCKVTPEEHDRYRLKSGDVLVARTGASTGENIFLSVVPDAVFASYLVRFQFADINIARLVGSFMRSEAYFDYVAGCIGGSAQPNASAQVLAGAQLVYPTAEIAREFTRLLAPFDRQIAANNASNITLAATRDLLLPKLMAGEIRLKDAERAVAEVA